MIQLQSLRYILLLKSSYVKDQLYVINVEILFNSSVVWFI